MTNLLFLLPIILAFHRGKYALGYLLFAVMIFSFLYHNVMTGSKLLGDIDQITAVFAAIIFLGYIIGEYPRWDVYKISSLIIGGIGLGVYGLGKTKPAIYHASHNLFHVFSAVAAFIILLPAA